MHIIKKIGLLVILAWVCLSLTPVPCYTVPYYRAKFVYDGDTILLENGEQVRYLGLDAPEVDHKGGKSQFMGREAWKRNRQILSSGQVRLEQGKESRDRYGRLLAYVFLKNGKMVNEILVQEGMAYVMFKSKGLKYRDCLLESQRKAMKKKVGIWSREIKEGEKAYLAKRGSYCFHRSTCPFGKKISPKNRVRFKDRDDAFWEGYSPCRQCNP
jgi:micrococcal nuclease